MNYRTRLLAVFFVFAFGTAFAQETETFNGHRVRARQVLIRTSGDAALPARLARLMDADESRPLSRNLNLHVLHSRSMGIAGLINRLRNEPGVLYVEPDYVVSAVGVTPNEVLFSQQWSFQTVGASSAWSVSTGGTANVAGVVDTGIDYTHPDLAANVWSAPTSFTVNLSWGTITCPAGSHGYNAIARSCDPRDDNGHGTHVSGTIGAVGNNLQGVAGLNWQARIMGLKFLDGSGNGFVSNAVDAIEFALQAKTAFGSAANVRVLSNSWAGDQASQALLDEINRANTGNVLFVAAAGNNARNNDVSPTYPASFTAPNIVSVAATGGSDTLASFSNYGRTSVHLGAPGVNILSTWPNLGYATSSGTSMATPHVAGAALLVLSACSASTAQLKSLLLSSVDLVPALANSTVTGGRLNVDRAIRSCGAPAPGTASFVKVDTSTRGSWKGVYGADGAHVLGDAANYPSYASATPTGNNGYTWAPSTFDPRAMQKLTGSDNIASTWYTGTSFNIDLRFNDSVTHQFALYMLDWDFFSGGRSQRVEILNSGGAVLDTRVVSGFSNGQYLVWNLSGQVVVRVTNLNPLANAVVSGLLFGGTSTSGGSADAASFVKVDTTTQGSWKSVYGSEGANILGDTANYPAYVAATPSAINSHTWTSSTGDLRALQKIAASDRIASCWYTGTTFNIDLRFTDTAAHQVALYMLDWDTYGGGRSQRIEVLNSSLAVLDSRIVSGFASGQYVVWNLTGHVVIRVTNLNPFSNAVVNGLLFGGGGASLPTPSTASYVKLDTTTRGSWKGVYGSEGVQILGDAANYPANITATPSANASHTWVSSTSDTRAMQTVAGSNRIASCWYSGTSFTVDLNFADSATHQLALYMLDWDTYLGGRSQRVEILSSTGAVLDMRTVSGFSNGQYLVWNLTGHVVIRVTNLSGGSNAVISGLLFGN